MTKIPLILAAIATAVLAGCTASGHSDFSSLGPDGWAYGDTLRFFGSDADSVALDGSLAVAVRHTNGYPYSNLWLEITLPEADTVRVDTVDIRLADTFGRWYGTGIGVSYQRVDTIYPSITIAAGAPVTVRHIMRVDTVTDIEQVGLIITPARATQQ